MGLEIPIRRTTVLINTTNSIPFVRTDLIQDTGKMALCSRSFVRAECLVIDAGRHIANVHNEYNKVTHRKGYFNADDVR